MLSNSNKCTLLPIVNEVNLNLITIEFSDAHVWSYINLVFPDQKQPTEMFKISQNSLENTFAKVFFLIKLQPWACNFFKN